MPREDRMFGSVAEPTRPIGSRQGASVLIATLLEAVVVAIVIVVPLMAVDVVPVPLQAMDAFVMASPPPPPPPAPPAPARTSPEPRPSTPPPEPVVDVREVPIPLEAPPGIAPEPPTDNRWEFGASVGAVPGLGDGAGVPGGSGDALPPPPAPPVPPARVGGNIRAPIKTRHVAPVYPAIAVAAGVSDRVIIEATIGVDGRVTDARVLRGHPLLNDAALEAVAQWEFTPTLLNGVPTPVIMSVTVTFHLQ